jgi:hypothetical protein
MFEDDPVCYLLNCLNCQNCYCMSAIDNITPNSVLCGKLTTINVSGE